MTLEYRHHDATTTLLMDPSYYIVYFTEGHIVCTIVTDLSEGFLKLVLSQQISAHWQALNPYHLIRSY